MDDTIEHPVTGRPQAVGFEYDRFVWKILDDSIAADIERIDDKDSGEFTVRTRTLDDQKWLIEYVRDDGPKTFYLYKRKTAELKYLFSDRPELEPAHIAPMHSAIVKSRDGLDLMAHYTLPVGSTDDDPKLPPRGRCRWCCVFTVDQRGGTAGDTTPTPASCKSGLCGLERELSGIHGLWEGVHKCSQPGVGRSDA